MKNAKEEVLNMLKCLPDDCTLEDIQYHLFVLQKTERESNDTAAGYVYTQEEVDGMTAEWVGK